MPRPKKKNADDQIEEVIRRASCLGDLERLAGVAGRLEARSDFWRPYRSLPAGQSIDAGVAELKRPIRLGSRTTDQGREPAEIDRG